MYEEIKEQVFKVIQYSQDPLYPSKKVISNIIDEWAQAKARFIEMFGGLIYESPEVIEYGLSEDDKKRRAKEFITNSVRGVYELEELYWFLKHNIDSFFDNKVTDAPDKYKHLIGMKLIKSFKFFIDDKNLLREVQDCASTYMQQQKLTGKLCFSVHPLDFLSSSENNYNWRSCHALDGDYRVGNFSYMLDETTFMVYIKSEKGNVFLEHFPNDVPWNSKKWRTLFHTNKSNSLIIAGRQYPYHLDSCKDIVLNLWEKMTNKNFSSWKNNYVTSDSNGRNLQHRYMTLRNSLYPLEGVVKVGPNALNYNDILHSSVYDNPYYAFEMYNYDFDQLSTFMTDDNRITIGAGVPCLCCGCHTLEDSSIICCDRCNDYIICNCCDQRISTDEPLFYVQYGDITQGSQVYLEEIFCEDCIEKYTGTCSVCGARRMNHLLYLIDDELICKWCMNNKKGEENG